MRRLTSSLAVVVAVPVALAVPVVTSPGPQVHPVAPHVTTVALEPLPAKTGVVADSGQHATSAFQLVGATYQAGTLDPGAQIEVRARTAGHWSSWTALDQPDGGPDGGSVDARAAAARRDAGHPITSTEPVWVGNADGVQARVVGQAGAIVTEPRSLRVVLVNGGTSGADSGAGNSSGTAGSVAAAAQAQPTILTRAQWGADESLRSYNGADCTVPSYASTVKVAFIHHTDNANGYSSSQVPGIIRSIYAYHVESNGWCDIGYNFLVDRFGRIWEGRYGGISRAVIGAHTGGFNTNSFGVSLIGNYTSTAPSSAMLQAVEKLVAWKLGNAYADPTAKTTLLAGAFSGSRYQAGSTVTFNVISGHRDADYTTCPGNAAYSDLGAIRGAVRKLMGAGLVGPTVAPNSLRMASGQRIAVKSRVLTTQSWTATVTDSTGAVVKRWSGVANTSTPIATSWDGTTANGLPAAPGTYTLSLASTSSSSTAVPYARSVTVTPPVTVTGPSTAAYNSVVTASGTALPGATVTVHRRNVATGVAVADQTITASSAGSWSTTYVADGDYSYSATSSGYTTKSQWTQVAPMVSSPAVPANAVLFVAQGGSVTFSGTALPGTTVHLVTNPATSGASVPVAANGTWQAPVVPSGPTVVTAVDSRGLGSRTATVYPVSSMSASAPTVGWSQRSFTVSGNAGGAPLSVQLSTKAPGASSFTSAKTVTATRSGAFAMTITLPQVTSPSSYSWQVTGVGGSVSYGTVSGTATVKPAFAPTASAAKTSFYNRAVAIKGTAVPGDAVTVWTRRTTGGDWIRGATVASSSSNGAWSSSFVAKTDLWWKAVSRSGTSAIGKTVIVPTLNAPASAASGARVTVSGVAIPAQHVVVYVRRSGSSYWAKAADVVAASSGKWAAWIRVTVSPSVYVVSHSQRSRTLVIRTS